MAFLGVFVSLLYIATSVAAQCIAFDAGFNLLVFGLGGKDYNAGTQDTWTSSTPATDITTTGRPPFDGSTTPTCYLSQFQNAIYILGADSKNQASVYIYDATKKSWTMQNTTPGSFDLNSFTGILDHDTNVFYALSNGELWFLDMTNQTAAVSSSLPWVDAKKAGFDTTGYNPVMALAQNHIHFLNVPGVPAGSADIFVIHFSYFQPDPQAFPMSNGSNFPATHGQTASFYQLQGVQQEFAFIPDDGSATYVVNVETNSTVALSGPVIKDSSASYAASVTSLVQLDSKGHISYLPYQQNNTEANVAAVWTTISSLVSLIPSSSSSSISHSKTTSTGTSTATGSATKGGTQSSGSLARQVPILSAFIFCIAMAVFF